VIRPHRVPALCAILVAIFVFGWLMYGNAASALGYSAGLLLVLLLGNFLVREAKRRANRRSA
jgi:hypothetical protein